MRRHKDEPMSKKALQWYLHKACVEAQEARQEILRAKLKLFEDAFNIEFDYRDMKLIRRYWWSS